MSSKNNDFQTFLQKMRETLPQQAFILEEDAKAWWKAVKLDKFNSEDWHLQRLRKVGGSESGILVAPVLGDPPPFDQTPAELYDRKLMRAEMVQNIAMKFGHEHEDIARKGLEANLAEKGWVHDTEGMAQLISFMKNDQGSMAYSPDDLFIKKDGETIRRLLVDYKCPYAGKIPGLRGEPKEAKPSYLVQLHHGKEVCKRAGLPVHDMILCVMDHPDNLARPKERRLVVLPIEENPELTQTIIRVCDEFIERLQKGQRPLPAYIPEENREKAELAVRYLHRLQEKLVEQVQQERLITNQVKETRESMAMICKKLFLSPEGQLNGSEIGLEVSPRISLSPVKGKESDLNAEITETEKSHTLDMEALSDFLKTHEKTLDDFQKESGVNMTSISGDEDRKAELFKKGLIDANISFSVSAKLKPENLRDYFADNASPESSFMEKMSDKEIMEYLMENPKNSKEDFVENPIPEKTDEEHEEDALTRRLEAEPMI